MIGLIRIQSIFAFIALLAAASAAQAQGVHALQGKVVLPNGAAPNNSVKVTLTFNGIRVYEVFTDLSGRFSFSGLHKGTYQLTAEGDGQTFETTTVYAEVAAFGNAPQVFTQNIQLRPKRGQTTPRTGIVSVESLDASIPERARKELQQGVKLAAENQPEKAIKHFQEAIAIHPSLYSAHAGMGEQLSKLRRYDEAAAAYQKAIEIKPDRAEAYTGLGTVLVKQKKYGEALAPLRRSIELEKQSSTPYLLLGLSEMMTGDYQSAESDLLRAYEIGKPTVAHIYLANLYDLRGEPEKAIEQLQAFLKENPETPDSRQIREVIERLRKQASSKK
ncbi:MAG TPA: tetratricopeptide repeat protein [Blastocatellia bacterium]|nr:tetratricopeptide repeat protein [Blastocatellia bacterium]